MWDLHLADVEGFEKGRFSEVRFAHTKQYKLTFYVFGFYIVEFCTGGIVFNDREALDGWRDCCRHAFKEALDRGSSYPDAYTAVCQGIRTLLKEAGYTLDHDKCRMDE